MTDENKLMLCMMKKIDKRLTVVEKRVGISNNEKVDIGGAEKKNACTFGACNRPHFAKGYCTMHYRRLKRGRLF